MEQLVELLHEGGYSCVLRKDGLHTFRRRGVADLYELLTQSPELLHNAEIADKVVGKGAAALMILGGVSRLYAEVLSIHALGFLECYGVKVTYVTLVPFIENRAKTGLCPVENLCRDVETPEECFGLIRGFLERMSGESSASSGGVQKTE